MRVAWPSPDEGSCSKACYTGAYSSPQTFWEGGGRFDDLGVNALFLHSGRVDAEVLARRRGPGGRRSTPSSAPSAGTPCCRATRTWPPVGPDGLPAPRTPRFLGACPTCPGLLLEKGRACAA